MNEEQLKAKLAESEAVIHSQAHRIQKLESYLNWVSQSWGGQRTDYSRHVLYRGGNGDLSDLISFIVEKAPALNETTPANHWLAEDGKDPHATHYDGERASLTLGKYTDDELANGAFLNYDRRMDISRMIAQDPDYHAPIVWMTAVKERIRWLSRALLRATAQRGAQNRPITGDNAQG